MNRWLLTGAVALLLTLGGALAGNHYQGVKQERNQLRIELASAQAQIETLSQIEATTSIVLSTRAASKVAINQHAQSIREAIPTYLPAGGSSDLPGSFRVLHDAAASGDPLPAAPGGADAAPVAPEVVAATVTGNYAQCRDVADQLEALQSWIRGVSNAPAQP